MPQDDPKKEKASKLKGKPPAQKDGKSNQYRSYKRVQKKIPIDLMKPAQEVAEEVVSQALKQKK